MAVRDVAVGEGVVSKPFVLAHLSDPHLGPLPQPDVRELASKRLIGYLNWRRSRHRIHRRDALDAITRDLRNEHPDHVAVTGDLVNIALPGEFAYARRWLEALGRPADVSVVPGNHDAYVAAAGLHRDRQWSPYMAGDGKNVPYPMTPTPGPMGAGLSGVRAATTPSPAEPRYSQGSATQQSDRSRQQPTSVGGGEGTQFPYLRRRGPVALIGLSTAIATPPFMATGRLGEPQIARMAEVLDALRTLFRVVMIHHPPIDPPSAYHKRLIDAARFRKAIAAVGAELIIHGHDHVHALTWLAGNDGRVPVVGVPSASAAAGTKYAGAYNLYRIDGVPGAWSCEVVSRGLRPSGAVAELSRHALSWSRNQ
jgi:3',5'-cyclic AMP phosphodiesterase CpdA